MKPTLSQHPDRPAPAAKPQASSSGPPVPAGAGVPRYLGGGGQASGLSERALEDLAAIGEPPSPYVRLATEAPYEVQMARYLRGQARHKARELDNEQRIQSEQATWDASVLNERIDADTRVESLGDLGRVLMGGMRWNQANIRQGGDDLEQWLKQNQQKSTRHAYADADAHQDDWYGPLLRANAVFNDMTSEFSTGVVRGGVTLGSGLLGAVANPVDTVGGALALGNDLVNPFADKKELNGVVQGVTKPYMEAVGEGRYLEAGGRLFFDAVSMLVGGELGAGTKGARGTSVVDDLARTLPAGDDLARTLPAGDDLAKTVAVGDELAATQPARPFPTAVMPGAPGSPWMRQLPKLHQWMDDFWRPQTLKPTGPGPAAAAAGELEAAAQARAPIVTHLSEGFHRTIWESIGGKGNPPVTFRHKEQLYVDYERLSPAARALVDEAKRARSPGSW